MQTAANSAPWDRAANSAPWFYSPSQLNTFALCQRRYVFNYMIGPREDAGPAAHFGTRVHKVLENWLAKGEPPNRNTAEGKVAHPAVLHLPLPHRRLQCEKKFRVKIGPFHYQGVMDLSYLAKKTRHLNIVDYKTTGDLIWQKAEEELLYDPQFLIYAKVGLDEYDVDEATLTWLYLRTRNAPKASLTKILVHRDHIDGCFPIIENEIREIERVRLTVTNPLDLPASPNACWAYKRKCPWVDQCNLTVKEKIRAVMAQSTRKTLAEKMKAKNKGKAKKGRGRVSRSRSAINPPESEDEYEDDEEEEDEEELSTEPPKRRKKKKKVRKSRAPVDEDEDDEEEEEEEDEEPPARRRRKKKSKTRTRKTRQRKQESEDDEEDGEEEEEAEEKPRRRRGRPPGAKNKDTEVVFDRRSSLVILNAGALAGGHDNPEEIAQEIWNMLVEDSDD